MNELLNDRIMRNVEVYPSGSGETFLVSRDVLSLLTVRARMGETEESAPISISVDDYNEMPIYRFSVRSRNSGEGNGGAPCQM